MIIQDNLNLVFKVIYGYNINAQAPEETSIVKVSDNGV
jgi:hypothetical protein